MEYTKPPLTFDAQADLILSRGLQAHKQKLAETLRAVNYYRLSGYFYPFQNTDDTFKAGTTLQQVWDHYTFDRQLRLLVLDAIERVEISIKTSLAYHHSHSFGAFGYLEHKNVPKIPRDMFDLFQHKMKHAIKQNKSAFVLHFQEKYGDKHSYLPLWMSTELMSFGMMLTFFRGVDKDIKRQIATEYDIAFGVMETWLHTLNSVRNICAHHDRLWNRILGIKPRIPAKDGRWHSPVAIPNDRMFGTLTILKHMLNIIAPQSSWSRRLTALFEKYSQISLEQMGFPSDWQHCRIWKFSPPQD